MKNIENLVLEVVAFLHQKYARPARLDIIKDHLSEIGLKVKKGYLEAALDALIQEGKIETTPEVFEHKRVEYFRDRYSVKD